MPLSLPSAAHCCALKVLQVTANRTIVNTEFFGNMVPLAQLRYTFEMKRSPDYYMSTIVWPVVSFWLISWSAFFIDPAVGPARVALGVIPILIILNLVLSSHQP